MSELIRVAGPTKGGVLRCSFCGKDRADVRTLIAGGAQATWLGVQAYICDECLDLCNEIILEDGDVPWPWHRLDQPTPSSPD